MTEGFAGPDRRGRIADGPSSGDHSKNAITFDPVLLEKFLASMHTVDVCDQSGKIVGHFTPKIDPNDYEVVGPEISDEELSRRMN